MRVNIGMPVVRTDGRSLARLVYGLVITKFSGMGRLPHFFSYGAPPTRASRAGGARLSLVYFDSSCQHSEVHYLDWKCDALTMRLDCTSGFLESKKRGEVIRNKQHG